MQNIKRRLIKVYQEENTNNILIEILHGILIKDGLKMNKLKLKLKLKKIA